MRPDPLDVPVQLLQALLPGAPAGARVGVRAQEGVDLLALARRREAAQDELQHVAQVAVVEREAVHEGAVVVAQVVPHDVGGPAAGVEVSRSLDYSGYSFLDFSTIYLITIRYY